MRSLTIFLLLSLALSAAAAEVESRVLTHYVPQDFLETAVRTEGWTEVTLNAKGGIRKGDRVRVWAGGSIDRGNGEQPGDHVDGPAGLDPVQPSTEDEPKTFALSQEAGQAYAVLFKNEGPDLRKCLPPGKPLEITMTKDKEKLWLGFNDERGRFHDNHLGKGRRHELDPFWIRIEVVRTIVD